MVGGLATAAVCLALWMHFVSKWRTASTRHVRSTSDHPATSKLASRKTKQEASRETEGLLARVTGRKLSCSTNGVGVRFELVPPPKNARLSGFVAAAQVVLQFDPATNEPHLIEEAVPTILRLARLTDLYLVTECDDDCTEQAIIALLSSRGLFTAGVNPDARPPPFPAV
jgi:hypothetical protein